MNESISKKVPFDSDDPAMVGSNLPTKQFKHGQGVSTVPEFDAVSTGIPASDIKQQSAATTCMGGGICPTASTLAMPADAMRVCST